MTRKGLALLEALVALVILSLLVVGYLRLLQGSHRLVARSQEWMVASNLAADAMEQAKLELPGSPSERDEDLPGGVRRLVSTRPWRPGLELITVTVVLPDGGELVSYRLAAVRDGFDAPR